MSRVVYFVMISILSLVMSAGAIAQLTFTKAADNPVMPYASGEVNDPNFYKYMLDETVIYDSAKGVFRAWFVGEPFTYGARFCMSAALSLDGHRWFVDLKNPVLAAGPDNSVDMNLRKLRVLHDSGGYRMYYTGDDGLGHYRTCLATSSDGTAWTKYPGNPIFNYGATGEWDATGVVFQDVVWKEGTYYMWYSASDAGGNYNIGMATSADGVSWTRYAGNPVLGPSHAGWDSVLASSPAVIVLNNTFYMFYLGRNVNFCCHELAGLATSPDGIHWTRSPSNPIIVPSAAGGWDDQAIGTLAPLVVGDQLYLYYCAQNSTSQHWQIGLATTALGMLAVGPGRFEMPRALALEQSFPNPFNPSTQIRFQITERADVSLKVYDMLGRELATLVSGEKTPGTYSVTWSGDGFPSGVYFYRLKAGDREESRKMVLMK